MANYLTIIPFILQAEGGLSNATTDAASADPVPDGSGNHTNEGITWTTFKTFMSALGIPDIATAIQRFYAMSQSDWGFIFKAGYWDQVSGDQINSQGTAQILVDWAWGAGPAQAVKKLQQFLTGQPSYGTATDQNGNQYQYQKSGWLVSNNAPDPGLSIDGGMGPMTLTALNAATRINEKKFITDFAAYKLAWYTSLPNQSANYAGWTARLNALTQLALSNPVTTGLIASVVVIGSLVAFFFTESFI